MRYSLFAGGKRLRPFLVLSGADLFEVPRAWSVNTAAAIEMVHTYSLVHDDLPAMDDDDLRRGKPTCHIAFDEATAILVGDSLLTLAFEAVTAPAGHPDAAVRAEIACALARAAGADGMAGGQAIDLAAESRDLTLNEVITLQRLKTGALFGFACEAGAMLAREDGAARAALRDYAACIGLAFQIADDLLDHEGTEADLGKAVGKGCCRRQGDLRGPARRRRSTPAGRGAGGRCHRGAQRLRREGSTAPRRRPLYRGAPPLSRRPPGKERLDTLLVARGLAETRTKAQALLLAGRVYSGERRLDKPGTQVDRELPLTVRGTDHPWVSRGGVKLDHALTRFEIDPSGLIALDIGASTGGFTDVLCQRGARRVYAVDVGYGQLDARLRGEPRVTVLERTNARHLSRERMPEPIDLIVCDASFIGPAHDPARAARARRSRRAPRRPDQAAVRGRARPRGQGRHRPRPRRSPGSLRNDPGLAHGRGLAGDGTGREPDQGPRRQHRVPDRGAAVRRK